MTAMSKRAMRRERRRLKGALGEARGRAHNDYHWGIRQYQRAERAEARMKELEAEVSQLRRKLESQHWCQAPSGLFLPFAPKG